MDRFHNLLNNIQDSLSSIQKTHKDNTTEQLYLNNNSSAACSLKAGDMVKNINPACVHYGSEGIVQNIEELPDHMGQVVVYKTTNAGSTWSPGDMLKKTENQLANMQMMQKREPSLTINEIEEPSDLLAEDYEDEEEESPDHELQEYKMDFYEMSVGSLRAIATHAQEILNSLDNPMVKENLTESWLQGKIAITEDYMRTIHDFIMYVSEAADNISAADRPGLWENIRKKKERMGKNYKPAKPGDKDRPDPEQWKKLQKLNKKDKKDKKD